MRYKHSADPTSKRIMPKLGHGSSGLAAFSRRHANMEMRNEPSTQIVSICSMGE